MKKKYIRKKLYTDKKKVHTKYMGKKMKHMKV